jgi:hypothetical protein
MCVNENEWYRRARQKGRYTGHTHGAGSWILPNKSGEHHRTHPPYSRFLLEV